MQITPLGHLWAIVSLLAISAISAPAGAGEYSAPWEAAASAIVLDPFGGNTIDWAKVATDPKVVGIIHKASHGAAGRDGQYTTRRTEGRRRNYLWGSYHLLTTAPVEAQITNYLSAAGLHADETYAIDVECLEASTTCQSAAFKVSFIQIESAIRAFKARTGRLPLLYANDSVARALSARWARSTEFGAVGLWYARFKRTVTDFPKGPWQTYALWQFSSEINCGDVSCPYRVPGTQKDMDLNVYFGPPDSLRAKWPLDD